MSVTGGTGTGATRPGYEGLYDVIAPAAYRTALSVLRSPADAEDVAQDACLVAFTDLREGKVIKNPKQYVRKVAFRLATEEKARAAATTELPEETAVEDSSDIALRATSIAWKACEPLTKAQRAAVILNVVEGMTGEEVGEVLGISKKAAQELSRVGRENMLSRCIALIGHRREEPPECQRRAQQIWALAVGRLDPKERAEVEAHLAACAYCRETKDQLDLARRLAAFLPLFPLDRILERKSDVLRMVADRVKAPSVPSDGEVSRRLARIAIGSGLALVIILALTVPAVLRRPAPLLKQAPPPPAVAALTGYAYLSKGELFYAAGVGAQPVQLTETGGRVDAFRWSADGRSIVYKRTQGATVLGDLYQVDLTSLRTAWSLVVGAAAFSLSPDGSSYVAAVPAKQANGTYSYRLLIGAVGSSPDRAREIDLATPVTDRNAPGYLTEAPPVLWSVNPRGVGVWWTAGGIHLEAGIPNSGYDVDPASKRVTPHPFQSAFDPVRAYVGPATSQLSLGAGVVQVTTNGQTSTVQLPAAAVFLSVNQVGDEGLATVLKTDGGHDLYLVRADGSVIALSNDGQTALGLWRPTTNG